MSRPVQKKHPRPRGRPRLYDPQRALARATQSFWRGGLSGTSLEDLVAATAMNKPSLYGAFGDKRALYLAAMDGYAARAGADMRAALERHYGPCPTKLRGPYTPHQLPAMDSGKVRTESGAIRIAAAHDSGVFAQGGVPTDSSKIPLSKAAFGHVLPRLVAAPDRDAILEALLDFLSHGFSRVIVFVHLHGMLRGKDARGPDLLPVVGGMDPRQRVCHREQVAFLAQRLWEGVRHLGQHRQSERDGVVESPYATNGADTGMRWLADKSDCLTVRPGEGYCRDR